MEEMKVKWFRGGARDPGSEKGRKAEFRQLGEEKRAFGMQKVIGPLTWGSSPRRGGNMKPGIDTHTREKNNFEVMRAKD